MILAGVFVAIIVGFVFYSIGNSDAAATAKEFLRNNERLKQDIGTVREFGSIVTGGINVQNAEGYANLSLKVIGERRTVNASVELRYHVGRPWRVTAASYKSESGQTVELLNIYESRSQTSDLRNQDLRSRILPGGIISKLANSL
jgi:hypothetical protein